jgi:hypothetical protein
MMSTQGKHPFQLKTYVPMRWHQMRNSQSWKYTAYMLLALLGGMFILSLPILYWLNQNYEFFKDLALTKAPSLFHHLQREQIWINTLYLVSSMSLLVLNSWLIHRLIGKFEGPARSIETHLKKLIRGEWNTPELRIRDSDELRGLVDDYNYFYKTLQTLTVNEIKTLEKIRVDRTLRDSYSCWYQLLQQKKSRMGYADIAIENITAASSSLYWRRVS